ncbi:MAG: Rieske 2Fe-2S domain-containing protein [Planctomycetota bacterium]|jgi:cytochrome b6-f complex iron-sulfur subunit|nr:Rieske 2Fe-2S domain-containing protein [Planctomycetota bacterium]
MGRRTFIGASVFGFIGVCLLATVRFFFPRTLFEPKLKFPIGYPADYGFGVDTKYQQAQRIWVVRDASGIFVIFAKCTHLGCTPDWNENESKFKCPCHGSGFDSEGVNFEGPAPRPLDRLKVSIDAQGQIVVDKSVTFGGQSIDEARESWKNPSSFLAV